MPKSLKKVLEPQLEAHASEHVSTRRSRHRLRAMWDTVERMLTDPKAPRRDAAGRDVFEVWADLVLQNPPLEFARVAREILPPEKAEEGAGGSAIVTNIQSLYLTAVQAANRAPDPRIVTEVTQEAPGYDRGTPDTTDW
jgi:hypothetical protein